MLEKMNIFVNMIRRKNQIRLYDLFLQNFASIIAALVDLSSPNPKPTQTDLRLVQHIISQLETVLTEELLHEQNKKSNRSVDEKTLPSEGMILSLINCTQLVPLHMLDSVFESIRRVFSHLPEDQSMSQRYYRVLYEVLSNSLDYTRKQRCVNFYLSMTSNK